MNLEEKVFWKSKTLFLDGVSGREIQEQIEKLNNNNSFVVATQPIYRREITGDKLKSHALYDAFIYYKVRP